MVKEKYSYTKEKVIKKDILSLTKEELLKEIQIPAKREIVYQLLREGLREIQREIERLEEALFRLASKGASLMVITSVVSFIFFEIDGDDSLKLEFLKHYLVWSLPYLFAAIICFFVSSLYPYVRKTSFTKISGNSELEILVLREEVKAMQELWKMLNKSYKNRSRLYKLTLIFTFLFIFSFSFYFYLFIFYRRLPNLYVNISLTLIFITFGAVFFILISNRSKTIKYKIDQNYRLRKIVK